MPLLEENRFLTELNKARTRAQQRGGLAQRNSDACEPLFSLALQLYERHKTSGTVWVTMKRSAWEWTGRGRCSLTESAPSQLPLTLRVPASTADQRYGKKQKAPAGGEGEGDAGGAGAAAAAASEGDYKCLVRATDGKRKFSTAVRSLCRFAAPSPAVSLTRAACRLQQLTGKQLSRFLASYSIMQKVRLLVSPVGSLAVPLTALHFPRQAHMDALKSRPKERGATAKRIKQRETRALG